MAAPRAAEDGITHCMRCQREFRSCPTCTIKQCESCDIGLKIPAPKARGCTEFWFICGRCLGELGGVYWVKKLTRGVVT